MSLPGVKTIALTVPATPNLPLAADDYSRQYQDQHNNILRLHFNQIQNFGSVLSGPGGGRFLSYPYASVQRTTDKTFTANIATEVTFNENDFLNFCSNDGTNGITVEYPGIYNYQFSVQWRNTDSQIHDAWIWLRINNTDVAGTSSQFSVINRHGSVDGHVISAANFYIQLAAGDAIKMFAAVSDISVAMEAYPAQTSPFAMPSIPSVVATLTFVSFVPT